MRIVPRLALAAVVLASSGCAGNLETAGERVARSGRGSGGLVSAAVAASNGQHRMAGTLGPSAGQGTMKNARHRLEGGLLGATR